MVAAWFSFNDIVHGLAIPFQKGSFVMAIIFGILCFCVGLRERCFSEAVIGEGLSRQIECTSPEELFIFHEVVHIFGALGIGFNKFMSLMEELLISCISFLELRVKSLGKLEIFTDLRYPTWMYKYLLL